MAMRRFNQNSVLVLEAKTVRLYAQLTIGAAGAVTIVKTNNLLNKGIKSVTKQATAGQYTILLEDSYARLLKFAVTPMNATGLLVAGSPGLVAGSTNVRQSGGGVVTFQLSSGGTATNPAAGDVLYVELVMADSSI